MMYNKYPRLYAFEIIKSKSKKDAEMVVNTIPDHLLELVKEHVRTYYAIKKFKVKNRR